jgi:magnesium-transporting ATPase (P-type)
MCVLFSEAVVLFASSFNSNPFYELFGMWQLNLIYLTTHMFPSVGIVFGRTSRTVMNEKPRDSTEIISKNLFYLLLIQVALIGGSFALSYVLCDSGIIGISEVNKSGLPLDILLKPIEKDGVVVFQPTLTMIKARTLSFMVLFIVETLVMPMQIRRINQPITESYKDIDYKSEFLFYIPSVIILLIAIYNTEFQLFMESINWPLRFMILDGVDWIIVILFVLPTLVGFELVRAWARKKQIFF